MTESIRNSILLVEDEAILAMTEKMQLEKYGYTVKIVTTGEDAVEAINASSDIDLILMDINLGSGIDGTQAAAIILKDHDIPIVFLSSHTEPEVVEKTEKITSYGYVVKNSSITVLDASIKMAIKLFDANEKLTSELAERKKVEEKYHSLFDQSMEGIYLHDLDGRILDVNTMACAQSGYSREELLDLTVFDLHPCEDKTNLPKTEILQDWREWKTGQRQLVEAQHQRKDGTVYPVEISTGVVRYGNEKRIMAIVKDVTDHKETANLIKEYSNRLELGMEAANMAWWEMDVETGNVDFSSKKAEMLGYSSDQFHHYEDFTKLVHPDDYEPMMTSMRALLDGPEDRYDIEYRIKAQSGEYRWFHDMGTVTQRTGEGKPLKVSGIVIHVTERKRAGTELAESVKLLSRAQKIAHIGNWHLDLTTNRLRWSDEIYRLFGCEPQEFAATYEAFLGFVHPDDRAAVDSAYTRSVREGNNGYDIEHRIVRRDSGDVRYVHEQCDHERDETGTIIRSIGMVQDITKRKQAEEKLRKSEERFRHMVNAAPLGIAITDSLTGEFFLVNPAMSRITGRSVEELERADWVSITHPDDIQPDKEKMAEMNGGKISGFQLEKRFLYADGQYFWVNITVAPIHVTDKSKPRHLLMVEDITERKQAEEEIQKQLTEKETLLREVHHRVKNNIANIESLLSLQAGSTAHAEVKAALQDTISRVKSMRVLYDKLLMNKDLRKVSSKNYAENLIDSIVTVFDSGKNITIEKHIVDFEIDARKAFTIGIILNELLTNIFKYAFGDCSDGLVSVSIDKEESAVTLIIQDNGRGFDERALENKSPGFGLTVVKILVEQLGGTYSLSNDHGARSVVRFEV